MSEGEWIFVAKLPGDWPPDSDTSLASSPRNDDFVQLRVLPDARLHFTVKQSNKTLVSHTTQPIIITGAGFCLFHIRWSQQECSLRINSQYIPSAIHTLRPFHIQLKNPEANGPIATQHPDAVNACGKWMKWRADKLRVQKKVNTSHLRDKTPTEQINELGQAINGLEHLLQFCTAERRFLIDYIAAGLRALIYWDDGRKYNPILLRVAARTNPALPLPIFALTNSTDVPEIIAQANYHYLGHEIGLHRLLPSQELMDIQEWLDSDVQIENFGNEGSLVGVTQTHALKARDVIRECASTIAVGHYHEHVGRHFDKMRQIQAFDTPLLFKFLESVSRVVLALGKFVLNNTKS